MSRVVTGAERAVRHGAEPVGYVVSHYPAVSHTFVQREVRELRALGTPVHVFSVHRADPEAVLSRADAEELEAATALLPVRPGRLVAAHAHALLRSPRAYWRTLADALAAAPRGIRARVWQLFYFGEAVMVWAECRRRGIRHLHAHLANVGADVAWWAAALGRAIDGSDRWWWSFTMHGCLEFWDVSRFNLVRKVADAELVVCISEFTRAQLMALCPPADWPKLVVVHTGVDLERYTPRGRVEIDDDPVVTVLAVGRLSAEKGHLVLIDALAELHARDVPVRVVLVGDGPLRGALEQHAQARGVGGMITFTGAIGQDEMPQQFARADVFVQPSFMEGIPVVLMEAMAAGLPVVSSGVAGIPELVQDGCTGMLVPPGRPDLLADALERVAREPDRRRRMGCAARAAVEADFDAAAGARAVARHFAGRGAPATR